MRRLREIEDKFIKLIQRGSFTKKEIGDSLNLNHGEVTDLIDRLIDIGVKIDKFGTGRGVRYTMPIKPSYGIMNFERKIHDIFGVTSDWHLASTHTAVEGINAYIHFLEDQGISQMFHGGDFTDGSPKMHRGMEHELLKHTYYTQVDYVNRVLDEFKGKIILIEGNHDWSWRKSNGGDILRDIANERKDIDYLEVISAMINDSEKDFSIYLFHPAGGVAYSRSYKMQKRIEQLAPENRPDLFLQGHYHISGFLNYVGVNGIDLGTFKMQDDYLARKGLHPELGAAIVETDGERIKYEWLPLEYLLKNDRK